MERENWSVEDWQIWQENRLEYYLYIAYKSELSEGSEVFHNDLRRRFNSGDPEVINAMIRWADIAEQIRACLQSGQTHSIGPLLDANFELRKSICNIHPDNIEMVDAARSVGARPPR